MKMKEPIHHFLDKEGFDRTRIKDWVIGEKYVGIMLDNGNIGVCATLENVVDNALLKGAEPDPSDPSHRIILNAWFNAVCNYWRSYSHDTDIFDRIDFKEYHSIVMVGYFESLHLKFTTAGIPVKVFDINKQSDILSDIGSLYSSLGEADAVILTGTSIFNQTFMNIVGACREESSIFLLGPSNTLSRDMFAYPCIRIVFGSVFKPYDSGLFEKIANGAGTKGFIDHLQKVYINSENA